MHTLINVADTIDAQLESAAGIAERATRGSKRFTGGARNDRSRLLQRGRSASIFNARRGAVTSDYNSPPPLPAHVLPQPPAQPSSSMLMKAATRIAQRPDEISTASASPSGLFAQMAAARIAAGTQQQFHPLRVLRPYREAAAIGTLRSQVPLREEQVRCEPGHECCSRCHFLRVRVRGSPQYCSHPLP